MCTEEVFTGKISPVALINTENKYSLKFNLGYHVSLEAATSQSSPVSFFHLVNCWNIA